MSDLARPGLSVVANDGVATVTFDHPPINLIDAILIDSLHDLATWIEDHDDIRCAIFRSADEKFFLAHLDVTTIVARPVGTALADTALGRFQAMIERYATLSCATIAQVEGIARGGGSEFALALDMRFAAPDALFGQNEIALGGPPGGGGGQRLAKLLGRSRTLELLLSGRDIGGQEAAAYGYVNAVLPRERLSAHVDMLARSIAAFPRDAIARVKALVHGAEPDLPAAVAREIRDFNAVAAAPATAAIIAGALAGGWQTRDVELLGLAGLKQGDAA
ncbi:MAG: enoyl-CoA hydratase/isomerase family protein [Sphingorhabdus sp.]